MGLKELFIKDDGIETVNESNAQPVEKTAVQNTAPIQSAPTGHISADPNIVDTIWDKIIEKNRPGPDYLELKNNVEALEDLPISTEQKIQSAFKVLKKNYPSFKKEDIISAIDFYIKVVEEEKETGLSELDNIRKNNVDNVAVEIKQMQEQAAELKHKYDELQEKIATKNIEMNEALNDINMKNSVFTGSVEAVLNVLESDKQKIMTINL